MRSFEDSTGRAWPLAVDVDTFKRVRALAGVDLMDAVGTDLLARFVSDPLMQAEVIYAACQPEALAAGIDRAGFVRSLTGDALDRAAGVMLEAVVDFFPSARRPMIQAAAGKVKRAATLAVATATAQIEQMDVEALIQQALGASSTNTPASPASTPAPLPSAS